MLGACRSTSGGSADSGEDWYSLEALEAKAAASEADQGGEAPSTSGPAATPSGTGVERAPASEPAGASQGAPSSAADEGVPVHGRFTTRYRGRWTPGYADNDLFGYLSLDVGDPERHAVTAHADMRGSIALDGLHHSGPFQSILDTYDSDVNGRLYTAYVDLHKTDGLDLLRIGRMQNYLTPVLAFFDGVAVETESLSDQELKLGTYGGRPVHLYDDSTQGDWLFGMYGESQPWKGGRMRLDYMRADDEVSVGTIGDDLWNLGLWQRLDKWRLEGSYSLLGGRNRDLRLGGTWTDLESDARVRLDFYRLLSTQFALPLEFDWFSQSLLELKPYTQVKLLGTKRWAQRYRLQAGADLRRVTNSGDQGTYNRDVNRFYVGGTIERIITDSTALTLTLDTWDGDGRDYDTVSGDLSHVFTEATRGSLGTYYALYSIDAQTGTEQEDVRTWFLRCDHKLGDDWVVEVRYDHENTSVDDFQVLRVRLSWNF